MKRMVTTVRSLGRTAAAAGRMSVPAAAAGVHGAHQHETAGQRQGAGGPGDGHLSVLQRLAQGLQRGFVELRQLVQKQDAVVGERHLARPHGGPAACQRRGGGGVVGGSIKR